ncbi:MAG: DUF262 domain-containing protein [Oscillospiraceae bacterium]|nr:DUF262 domain-containing protein [Oscillospiraceae bacterium]
MPIKSNPETHTVGWLKRQDADGKLNKNISIQRKEVWDAEKKSNLMASLLLDVPIESLLFEEAGDAGYNVLDGKQRTLTLCAFIADQFELSPKIRVKEIYGQSLIGMKFSDLPITLQSQINEYELSISVLRPLDAEERATVFFMRNQAVALSKMDLSRVMLGQDAIDALGRLCEHRFMREKIKLTEPARRKSEDIQILLQYMILRFKPEMGFSGADIMSVSDDIKNEEIRIPIPEINSVIDYLDKAFTDKRQYLKKVHVPVVMFTAQSAIGRDIAANTFGALIDNFFESLDENGEYMTACKSGSAKHASVQTRVRLMGDALDSAINDVTAYHEKRKNE